MKILLDESAISQKLSHPIPWPIRVFRLERPKLEKKLASSFRSLAWDLYEFRLRQIRFLIKALPEKKNALSAIFRKRYHAKTGLSEMKEIRPLLEALSPEQRKEFKAMLPRRRRAVAKFDFAFDTKKNAWKAKRIPTGNFVQGTPHDEFGSKFRKFKEADRAITSHPEFLALLQSLGELARESRKDAKKLRVFFHQGGIVARAGAPTVIVPEGIHQDGADYIISALVISRKNIKGGESVLCGGDKKTEWVRTLLKNGEGIFQADKNTDIWHWVTPLEVADPKKGPGERNTIGFDIEVVG